MDEDEEANRKAEVKAQYQYRNMASLVLKADRSSIPNRQQEPTGEPETLWGRYDPKTMGDRVQREQPTQELDRMKEAKQRSQGKQIKARDRVGATSVLDAVNEFEGLMYRPRTRESKDTYALILNFLSLALGDQSRDVLRSAADEILAILKDGAVKDFDKKQQVEFILGEKLTSEKFNQLVNLGKKITDYDEADAEADKDSGAIDTDAGVAVVFDDEEDDEDDVFEVDEESDAEEDEQPQLNIAGEEQQEDRAEELEDEEELVTVSNSKATTATVDDTLSPLEVDGFWLHRTVTKYYPDPVAAQEMSAKIMEILQHNSGARECENALVQLLNYSNFPLVKIVTKNKDVIYWCTLIGRAGDNRNAVEKDVIEAGFAWIVEARRGGRSEQNRRYKDDMEVDAPRKRQMTMAEKVVSRAPTKLLDLDAMAFNQGSHLMTNKKCELPKGSFKTTHKSYEEVTVPAPQATPMGSNEKLVSISSLPAWSQMAFKSAKSLNRIQSRVYKTAFETDENLLICAPTGGGKTNVAMLTMLRAISKFRDPETGSIDLDAFKIIYIAPMKALVQEVVGNFSSRLTNEYGIKVAELTGDRQMTKQQIAETQLIVTTPEKWDIITRKAHDRSYTQLVRLVIIDEIHLLHDDRGPVLESIVARTIRGIESSNKHVRLVGLSATLPNYHDVASFLRVDRKDGIFYFDNSSRPCPLQQNYIGITEKKVIKRLQIMNEICYEKCAAEAGKNQILVFVHSRKDTVKTAKAIRDLSIERETISRFFRQDSASREILASEAESCKNKDLQDLLPYGFACHNAGMTRADRTLVEELFADGHIQVLVSTATLAWGVNLPAHTVIIKGTQVYSPDKGRWIELSPQDVLQMLGRAGRPQYDTFGEGIIITAHQELQFYLSLLNVQLPIESQLVSKLPDMLNAEIVLGTVKTREDAVEWLSYTYLYIRMLRDPSVYGISAEEKVADPYLEQKRIDIIHAAAVQLDKAQLIKYDKKTGRLQVTELGRIASHYYISHKSMATYNQHLKPSIGIIELFRVFALSEEFKFIPVREEEKLELQKLVERVPIPVKDSVDETTTKINVLLQSYISMLKLEGFALVSDMVYVTQSAGRILRAMFEICLRRNWAQLARKALDLCKMVEKRMWLSMSPLRQFRGVNVDLMRRLEKKEFPWERMYDLNPQELGELVRSPEAGKPLHELVHKFPKLDIQTRVQPLTRSMLNIDMTITPNFNYDFGSLDSKGAGAHSAAGEMFWVLVEDCDQEKILYSDQFILKPMYSMDDHQMSFTVPMTDPLPPNYFISVISDRWLHAETRLPVSFKHLILPAKFPPHTELLDLRPLPISALQVPAFIKIYAERGWQYFNPVQTQVFNALYTGNENVFVGAPNGSGKTACVEVAIMRHWKLAVEDDLVEKVLYVVPFDELCKERFLDWNERLGSDLGKQVVCLTGESATDMKLMDSADLILTTPHHWDMISRRWKQRKSVQSVGLCIFDEMHMIGGEDGPVLEVIISRTRFMATQLEKPIRIVALSTSLGNARDIGEWIGCSSASIFNFHPNVRPVPMEIHMQSFNIPHFASLMLAMARPVYNGISTHCVDDKQALVFVPDRKVSRTTAMELLTYSVTEGSNRKFLRLPGHQISPDDEEETVERLVSSNMGTMLTDIDDASLKLLLSHGIGYLNEGQTDKERLAVSRMYLKGIVKVLIVTRDLAYALYDHESGVCLDANMVAIMGTQYFNGRDHRYVDYTLAEVLQMTGKACRSTDDDAAAPVLFLCPANKKEFYKKFLYEGLPVESHLDHSLHDHFNAEIVTNTIETKQDAVDYLTWSYMYRRMALNPNYYNLIGVTHRHLSDHLSELVETTLSDLVNSKCIAIDDDELNVSPMNLGMIGAYYYIHYLTIEVLSMSLTSNTKLRGLLEIVTSAAEFEHLPIRHYEDQILSRIYERSPVKFSGKPKLTDPHVKANLLLQSHFSRLELPADLTHDLSDVILRRIVPLIYASVDVLSSNGWLFPAMAAMEMCQMIVQAMWGDRESSLRQLPFFDQERIQTAKQNGVSTIADFTEIEDDSVRDAILDGLSPQQIGQVARVVNRYPDVDVKFELASSGEQDSFEDNDVKTISVNGDDSVIVSVQVNRNVDEDEEDVGPVIAPFFPTLKEEGWWLVVGDDKTKQLHSIKRLTLRNQFQCRLDFDAPPHPGTHEFKLFFMSDSWIGCDQEYKFRVHVEQSMDIGDVAGGNVPLTTSPSSAVPLMRRPLFWAGLALWTGAGYFCVKWLYSERKGKPTLVAGEFIPLKLKSREELSHDVTHYRFALPSQQHVAGMGVASCLLMKADLAVKDKKDENAVAQIKPVIRPYTPTTQPEDRGHMDFVIKRYPNGLMSNHLFQMKEGDTMLFKGPLSKIEYLPNKWKHVAMLAGGSGITPMYQVIRRALQPGNADKTKITLLYANQTPDDILLKSEMDDLAQKHPDRFKVVYTVDTPSPQWAGSVGHINESLLAQANFPKSQEKDAIVFVCGPPGLMKAFCGEKAPDKSQGEVGADTLLGKLGFTKENVFKF